MTAGVNFSRDAADEISFEAGQYIFREGEAGKAMYVVLEGEVNIVFRGVVLDTLSPSSILGEMALIDDSPRSASAIAKTDCKLVAITEKRFTFLVQQTPFFALQVMIVMANRLRRETEAAVLSRLKKDSD